MSESAPHNLENADGDPRILTDGPFDYVLAGSGSVLVGASQGTLLEFPSSLGGHPVVATIDGGIFFGANIPQVRLPNTLVSLGMGTFTNANISSLYIPASLVHMGRGALSFNTDLRHIEVDSDNYFFSMIDDCLVEGGHTLRRFTSKEVDSTCIVPYGIICLADHSFSGCDLTSIEVSKSVSGIEASAFSYCARLSSHILWGKHSPCETPQHVG